MSLTKEDFIDIGKALGSLESLFEVIDTNILTTEASKEALLACLKDCVAYSNAEADSYLKEYFMHDAFKAKAAIYRAVITYIKTR